MNGEAAPTSKASQSKSCINSEEGEVALEYEYVEVEGEYCVAMIKAKK